MRFSTEAVFRHSLDIEEEAEASREQQLERLRASEVIAGCDSRFVSEYLLPTLDAIAAQGDAVIDDPRADRSRVDMARGMRRAAILLREWIVDIRRSSEATLRGEEAEDE